MEPPPPFGGIDGFLRYVEHAIGPKHVAVLCLKEIGLLLGEQLLIVLAVDVLASEATQALSRSVEQLVAQVFRVFDEDHGRDVVDDGIEKGVELEGFSLGGALAGRALEDDPDAIVR